MEEIKVYCENTESHESVAMGATLTELADKVCPKTDDGSPILAALVDNKLKSLDYKIINPHTIRFIGYDHPEGRRTYIRSLCFVLQKVVREMYPDKILIIDYALPSGLYCEIRECDHAEDGRPQPIPLTDEEIAAIEERMRLMVAADLPFTHDMLCLEECCRLFEKNRQYGKANLLKSAGLLSYKVYFLDGHADTFHCPLVLSTKVLDTFSLTGFNDGFCLQYPMDGEPGKVLPMTRQSKIATALKEHSDWCSIMGVRSVGVLNKMVTDGRIIDLINLSEALHERKYAEIADKIYAKRDNVKIVFIAGPSSSGKTSCRWFHPSPACHLHPHPWPPTTG